MKETLLIKKFKDGILKMTREEKELWFRINTNLLAALNENGRIFRTKAEYRRESEKIYGKTVEEYYKYKPFIVKGS